MAGNSSEAGRSVTSKVVSLLDAFLPEARELSLNDLADRSGGLGRGRGRGGLGR